MKFLHYKIVGNKGDLVRVKVNGPCFVRLLDTLSFEYYKVGRKYTGLGGWTNVSAQEYEISYPGTWHVVVDLGKEEGQVRAMVDVVRK